ncbi:MAG: AAA domain-containing protein [Alphaproteobacteria bacterium]|nr:AAA domain-containing protein [Alphaproteobacteria bacterium]
MSAAEEESVEGTPDIACLAEVVSAVLGAVRDKEEQVRLALAAMLSGGHLLIEDAPGMGKTSLARALGYHLQLDWSRLQCTNDTTPSDIVGVNIFDPKSGDFDFRQGPVFTQVLLADEVNRAPSKSQSALLEAMAERQVTVDGASFTLPDPFIVIATQNPTEQIGVSPLPESQLDRFAVSFSLGLPSDAVEADILRDAVSGKENFEHGTPVLLAGDFNKLRRQSTQIIFNDAIIGYLQNLAARLRAASLPNLSVRALIQVKGLAQAHAMIDGRNYCRPEDVQAVFVPALQHRMGPVTGASIALLLDILQQVEVP